ncbi:MAG: penicillin-binding protein 2 [Anaerolineae bacterium]
MASLPIQDRQQVINRRLPFVIGFLLVVSGGLLVSVSRYQWLPPSVEREFIAQGQRNTSSLRRLPAERGIIYDRDGEPLAFNTIEYEVGVSANLIVPSRRVEVARQLAVILNIDEVRILNQLNTNAPWQLIARPVSAEVGQRIADLNIFGIILNPIQKRYYPQGDLAGQIIGFTIPDNNDVSRGALGVEGFYNAVLAGQTLTEQVRNVPFELPDNERQTAQRGTSLVLTIDRDLQFWVEEQLRLALEQTGSTRGTIILMNPRNGDILAMASYPNFDPNNFAAVSDPRLLRNPAISDMYEPGSVMKVITVAAALELGVANTDWTYNDTGSLTVGGITIRNWDRNAYGVVDITTMLVQSLNVGAAQLALNMGPERFYNQMRTFGFGLPTRVDLPGEEAGIMRVPGEPDWSESNLATNAYGQGISVTPLQMLTAVNAIANDGLMMQPRIVLQKIDGESVVNSDVTALGRVISKETADAVTTMMIRVVEDENGVGLARLPGYSIAGKTGTAQIPTATGYEPNASIVSFVGFLPADDPQVAIIVRLDRPRDYWGSRVAAPVFRRLAERLVILMGIPNDEVRLRLRSMGGNTSGQ